MTITVTTDASAAKPAKKGGGIRWVLGGIVALVVLPVALRSCVIEAYVVPSGAMYPSLVVGDHFFVSKSAYGPRFPLSNARIWNGMPPKRGDVIVFEFPENREEDFVMRVIGLPGDTIEVRDGRVLLGGKLLPRCLVGHGSVSMSTGEPPAAGDFHVEYLDGRSHLTFSAAESPVRKDAGPWTVAAGEVFVLGDNRNNSRDSREWFDRKGGGVPFANIRGRAWWVWKTPSGAERIGLGFSGPPMLPTHTKELDEGLSRCLGPNPPLEGVP